MCSPEKGQRSNKHKKQVENGRPSRVRLSHTTVTRRASHCAKAEENKKRVSYQAKAVLASLASLLFFFFKKPCSLKVVLGTFSRKQQGKRERTQENKKGQSVRLPAERQRTVKEGGLKKIKKVEADGLFLYGAPGRRSGHAGLFARCRLLLAA